MFIFIKLTHFTERVAKCLSYVIIYGYEYMFVFTQCGDMHWPTNVTTLNLDSSLSPFLFIFIGTLLLMFIQLEHLDLCIYTWS